MDDPTTLENVVISNTGIEIDLNKTAAKYFELLLAFMKENKLKELSYADIFKILYQTNAPKSFEDDILLEQVFVYKNDNKIKLARSTLKKIFKLQYHEVLFLLLELINTLYFNDFEKQEIFKHFKTISEELINAKKHYGKLKQINIDLEKRINDIQNMHDKNIEEILNKNKKDIEKLKRDLKAKYDAQLNTEKQKIIITEQKKHSSLISKASISGKDLGEIKQLNARILELEKINNSYSGIIVSLEHKQTDLKSKYETEMDLLKKEEQKLRSKCANSYKKINIKLRLENIELKENNSNLQKQLDKINKLYVQTYQKLQNYVEKELSKCDDTYLQRKDYKRYLIQLVQSEMFYHFLYYNNLYNPYVQTTIESL
jgi:hypothetical protein